MLSTLCARCGHPAVSLSHCRICLALLRAEAHARGDDDVLEALRHSENLAHWLDTAQRDLGQRDGEIRALRAELDACRQRAAAEWEHMAEQIVALQEQLATAKRDALQGAVQSALTAAQVARQHGGESSEQWLSTLREAGLL